MNLGARLKKVADLTKEGCRIADIGTDHAYLPIYLIQTRRAVYAYACDVNQGPYAAALRAVRQAGLKEQIEVRRGDGLLALRLGEADQVVIAGMGGSTIVDILQAAPEIAHSIERFIFQPMNDAFYLRRWLIQNGWRLTDEALVEEDGRLYEIICAEAGDMVVDEEILLEIGPVLWQKKEPLLKHHLRILLDKSQRIIKSMEKSPRAKLSEQYREECRHCEILEEKLKCL